MAANCWSCITPDTCRPFRTAFNIAFCRRSIFSTRSSISSMCSVVITSMTRVVRCAVEASSAHLASVTVLARPTILGQSQSGRTPTVAPLKPKKSGASDILLVSNAKRRWRRSALLMVAVMLASDPVYVWTIRTRRNQLTSLVCISDCIEKVTICESSCPGPCAKTAAHAQGHSLSSCLRSLHTHFLAPF